ncbi:MAG TPA: hypothetical protein VMF08_15690 [Candidatus Sulfotelmatobacter sp.]|nr:hypothetical protein [Candidatus Sulfotelmatobacter sp.]
MNYRVRRQGADLGSFPLEELRRKREAGQFTGAEYVQGAGNSDWQPLDLVLTQGYRTPPPIPQMPSRSGPNQTLIWIGIGGGILLSFLFVLGVGYFMTKLQRDLLTANRLQSNRGFNMTNPEAAATAGKPIVWDKTTRTFADEQKREREFRNRLWLEGYEKHGHRNPECDAEAILFIRTYIARNYGGADATNSMSLADESDKLANDPNCADPLVLTIAADESLNLFDSIHRFQRALAAYPASSHQAYPQFYATIRLAGLLADRSDQEGALDTSALQLLKKCFSDGSFTPADQQEIAEILINGWGDKFLGQNGPSICNIVNGAGPDYKWLALTLSGEREINAAWAARGDGYADSVTDEGWQGFRTHLGNARGDLTAAWKMHPDWPIAPDRMMSVSLGDSGLEEMRLWFDRTTQAQIDYPGAWTEMRWGLRPRWYGNENAMLALGVAAINTGRFDTDVPRKYIDCIYDVESEIGEPPGKHIFGRDDVWPNLKRMYDGYVNAPSQKDSLTGWRTSYAIVAYFAGQYDVARAQLEALDWTPRSSNMQDWNVDLSLMPLEVAARTGPLRVKVSAAERARDFGDISGALKDYAAIKDSPEADDRTRQFIERRLSELTAEKQLNNGEWISFLPTRDNDPDWVYSFGHVHVLRDGAVQVESGPKGHMFFSRVRAGMNFEVRGQFELVHSANKNFQGGVVMGVPNFNGYSWYGFRLKRHGEEGDVACFAQGWTREQIVRHLVLNDVTNSFDVTFQDGKVTASVNGLPVFDHADPPREIGVPDNSCLVGLGAFNDSPDTVIRYRNIQLRKL